MSLRERIVEGPKRMGSRIPGRAPGPLTYITTEVYYRGQCPGQTVWCGVTVVKVCRRMSASFGVLGRVKRGPISNITEKSQRIFFHHL